MAEQRVTQRAPASEAGFWAGAVPAAATAEAMANEAAAGGDDGLAPKQAWAAADEGALLGQEEDLASSTGKAAGLSNCTAHDAAEQRAAVTDCAGALLEPKHDHARGAGGGPSAGGDEEQQREAQRQHGAQLQDEAQRIEEQQYAAQQQEEEQQREAQRLEEQQQHEEQQSAAQQQDEEQQREAQQQHETQLQEAG